MDENGAGGKEDDDVSRRAMKNNGEKVKKSLEEMTVSTVITRSVDQVVEGSECSGVQNTNFVEKVEEPPPQASIASGPMVVVRPGPSSFSSSNCTTARSRSMRRTVTGNTGKDINTTDIIAHTREQMTHLVMDSKLENDVETNIDLVEEKLYLGNLAAACDIPLLKTYRINYILTIDSCPLPTKITDLPFVETKYLKVSDMPREDILSYFEETNKFIDKAMNNESGGNILVHCYYGVSRSATIVLAYLMQRHGISLEEAQDRLKSRRSVVGPNYGFLSQLKLYEKMGFRIDKSNVFYKRFRLHVASDKLKAVKVLATPYTNVIKADPALLTVKPEPVVYQCKKCRRILACASNVLLHTENRSPVWFDFNKPSSTTTTTEDEGDKEANTTTSNSSASTSISNANSLGIAPPICRQMLFIEPLAWMLDVTQSLQGKLHCPNPHCKSKLGSFSWVMGCLCPCGAKVQPAFYLVPSKVDRSTSVLNVQITI